MTSGFKDYLPEEALRREEEIQAIRAVFKRFGFLPLETPALEKESVLTAGDPDFKKRIFRVVSGDAGGKLALRFDLTVPLARVIAAYPGKITKPFKRYQIGSAWRGEKPQKGRYREFLQCDADIVGSRSTLADAELISLVYEIMIALGLKKFVIKINNRKILNGLAAAVGFSPKKTEQVLRALDKLDKQSWPAVSSELKRAGLSEKQIGKVKKFANITGSNKKKLSAAAEFITPSNSPYVRGRVKEALAGIKELSEIAGYLKDAGVPDKNWTIDFSIARGLGYYTGPVFETVLTDLPGAGSVASGGRYDGLVGKFGSSKIPATGVSIGFDRLYAALKELKVTDVKVGIPEVLVMNFDESARNYANRIAYLLRRADISTEFYLGSEKTIKGQLAYALKRGVPIVVIAGAKEMKKKTVQVKNLKLGRQNEVSEKKLAGFVKKIFQKKS